MAREAGIEGFCYWHYWFGNGKRLLERPFNEVLASGKPDFPFCLAWANENWKRAWTKNEADILIPQVYSGMKDYEDHFYALLDAFRDRRYLTIDKKLIFMVYHPEGMPSSKQFTECWQELAKKNGLSGFHFIYFSNEVGNDLLDGFDGVVARDVVALGLSSLAAQANVLKKTIKKIQRVRRKLRIVSYSDLIKALKKEQCLATSFTYPMVISNWDNTPRYGRVGSVVTGSTPGLFGLHLRDAVEYVDRRLNHEEKIIFIKSWNEWAEGNYLEPDQLYGSALLKKVAEAIQ
jgi:hypothetical protein